MSSSQEQADQTTPVKVVVKLDIKKEEIGRFVGAGGSKIKDFVVAKTRTQLDGENGKGLFCQIISKGEEVFARLKAADEEAMEQIKENLMTHQAAYEKQKKFAGQTRYVFKFAMEHFKMGKFVGASGKNIRDLKAKVADLDDNLSNDKVFIQIKEDERFRMSNMKFVDCTTEEERDEGVQMVLITVSVYTEDRDKSLAVIQPIIEETVGWVNGGEEGNHASNELGEDEDPFEDSGW